MKIIEELTSWPFIVVMLCSFTFSYVISPDWLRAYSSVDMLLQWILNHVPALQEYVKKSSFPDVASTYFPTMVLVSPLHFIFIWRQENQHALWRELFKFKPIQAFFRLMVTTAFFVFIAIGSFMWGGEQLDSVPWNESKLALFLAGHFVAGGAFFGLLAVTLSGYKALISR